LAALLRTARRDRGDTQDKVIAASGVSRPTYLRYEAGKIDSPDPEQVTAVCRALGINPREAAIALGFGTRSEYDLPPDEPKYHEIVVRIGRLLADPEVSEAQRAALLHAVNGAFEAWQMAVRASAPGSNRT
jgi:transcriptional regulator with XRE-family HTH domain